MSKIYFVERNSLWKKTIFFVVLGIIYAAGLWFYSGIDHIRAGFKPYYLESYAAAAGFGIEQAANSLSSLGASNFTSGETPAASVPVLLYHGIMEGSDGVNVTLDNFKDQMIMLKRAGYQTITLEDLKAFMDGEKELPPKAFVITFDDGRKDSFYPSNPIFRALGFRAVMFAIGDYSLNEESSYYLTAKEVKSMSESKNWEVQSHTSTHRELTLVPQEELPAEIGGSKRTLEDLVGKPIIGFAYPFGDFGENAPDFRIETSISSLVEANYPLAFYQFSSGDRFTQNYRLGDKRTHYSIKRIGVRPHWTGEDLLKYLEGGEAKPLPYEAALDDRDGWIDTLWGAVETGGGKLLVHSLNGSTGSAVMLDGTRLWRNYEVTASVQAREGTNFYLWSRYQNDANYLACNFSRDLVHLEVTVDGKTSVIRGTTSPNTPMEDFTAGMRVKGREAECLINGRAVVTTRFLDESLDSGGIGIKTWHKIPGESSVEIDSLSVKAI